MEPAIDPEKENNSSCSPWSLLDPELEKSSNNSSPSSYVLQNEGDEDDSNYSTNSSNYNNSLCQNVCSSPNTDSSRRNFKKLLFDVNMSHEKRREYTLNWQKRRRDDLVDKIRQLEHENFSEEEEESMDFVKIVKKRKHDRDRTWSGQQNAFPTCRKWKGPTKVMLSEWFEEKPEDFEENWLGVICPVGLRCLVISTRGRTRIITRRGYRIGEFQSCLPAGRKYRSWDSQTNRLCGVTILDCIWSEEAQTFYVLDILSWNSNLCTDCDTEYRQFFLRSKLGENPELLEKSEQNPFPFTPLQFFPIDELPSVMSMTSSSFNYYFPDKIDGVLFFHKESFYIYGTNPCCLWLLLSQVPTVLGFEVSPELLGKEQPPKPPKVIDVTQKTKKEKGNKKNKNSKHTNGSAEEIKHNDMDVVG